MSNEGQTKRRLLPWKGGKAAEYPDPLSDPTTPPSANRRPNGPPPPVPHRGTLDAHMCATLRARQQLTTGWKDALG